MRHEASMQAGGGCEARGVHAGVRHGASMQAGGGCEDVGVVVIIVAGKGRGFKISGERHA